MEFRDIIRDVSITTAPFGFTSVNVTKEADGRVVIQSFTEDRALIMNAIVKGTVDGFEGKFGLSNLPVLQGLLGLKTFQTDSTKVVPVTNDNGVIKSIKLTSDDASTDFIVVAEKFLAKQPKAFPIEYEVQVQPSASKLQELKSMSGVFKSINTRVTPFTDDSNHLNFKFGLNKTTHSGALQFAVTEGELPSQYSYPVDRILESVSRMNTAESVIIKISSRGLMAIEVDTGVIVYTFSIQGG